MGEGITKLLLEHTYIIPIILTATGGLFLVMIRFIIGIAKRDREEISTTLKKLAEDIKNTSDKMEFSIEKLLDKINERDRYYQEKIDHVSGELNKTNEKVARLEGVVETNRKKSEE